MLSPGAFMGDFAQCAADLMAQIKNLPHVGPEAREGIRQIIAELKAGKLEDPDAAVRFLNDLRVQVAEAKYLEAVAEARADRGYVLDRERIGKGDMIFAETDELATRAALTRRSQLNLLGNTIEADIHGNTNLRLTQLVDTWNLMRRTHLGIHRDLNEMGRAVIGTMLGLDFSAIEKDALKAAGPLMTVIGDMLRTIDEGGLLIKQRDLYAPHDWSYTKAAEDIERFVNFMAPKLNQRMHGESLDARKAAARSFLDKVRQEQGGPPDANPLMLKRKWHFNDAESELAAIMEYGNGTPMELLENHVRKLARLEAIVVRYGPSPWAVKEKRIIRARADAIAAGMDTGKANAITDRSMRLLKFVSGETSNPVRPSVESYKRIIGNVNVLRLLGNMGLYVFGDAATTMNDLAGISKSHPLGRLMGGFFSDIGRQYDEWKKGYGVEFQNETQRIVASAGGFNAMFQSGIVDRIAPVSAFTDSATGVTRGVRGFAAKTERMTTKMANFLAHATGAHQFTRSLEESWGFQFNGMIADHVGKTWNQVAKDDPRLHRRLSESGWNQGTWDRVVHADHINDGLLDSYLMTDKRTQLDFVGMMNWNSAFAVNRPDTWTRSAVHGIGRAGTPRAAARWLALQFSGFGISYARQPVARAIREGRYFHLAIPMVLASAVTIQIRQFMNDKPLFEFNSPVFWMAAWFESGTAYLASTIALATAKQAAHGQKSASATVYDVVSQHLGPSADAALIGTVETVKSFYGAFAHTGAKQDRDLRMIFDGFAQSVPFQNYWLVNWTMMNAYRSWIREGLDPMYDQRLRKYYRDEGRSVENWPD